WLVGLLVVAWVSARQLLPSAVTAVVLFGCAALLTGRGVHLAVAALAFGATALLAARFAISNLKSQPAATGEVAWRDYVTLTKPRVMSLLLLTRGAARFLGPGRVPALSVFALTMVRLGFACGGAAAVNHYLHPGLDPLM